MHSTHKTIVGNYPTVADHLRMSLGSGGENVYVITSGYEILDIENLPIPEVIVYDDFNKKESLKHTLDLRQLVRQVNDDLYLKPIPEMIKDRNDLLIKLSISATALKQDVITVRLKDAFVNDWYEELQVILNNAPMKISSELELQPLPLIFDENKEVIVVTPQDIEEKIELIIPKEAGQHTYLHFGYDLIITNAFNADIETNKLCTIYLIDFFKESKMETLSIKFTDKEILLSDENDQINNSDNFRDKLKSTNRIAQLHEKLLIVTKECNLGKIIDIVNQGDNVKTTGSNKWTPLHWASKNCSAEVGYLIKQGANIDAKNNINRTPTHLPARNRNSSVVLSLVNGRANVDARDKDGKTPSDLAFRQKRLNVTSGQERDQTIEHLGKLNQERGKPLQRKRQAVAASSGIRPYSWINNCISWAKQLAASTFSIIPGLPAPAFFWIKSDNNNIPQSISAVGLNNFLNSENVALASCVADALDDTLSRRFQNLISKGIEVIPSRKVAVELALRKFDSFVEGKIRNLGSKEQVKIRVELKDAYPEITASLERGIEFSGNVGLDNVLEKCKKCFCTNVLPKDKVSTCLSDVGLIKLGNNLNR